MDEQKKVTQDGKSMVCTCCGHYGAGSGCACGCGGYGQRWMGHSLIRIVFALAIAFFVFWFGVKVGEFKSMVSGAGFGGHRGYYMMNGYQGYGGYGTMMPYGTAVPPVPATAATPAK